MPGASFCPLSQQYLDISLRMCLTACPDFGKKSSLMKSGLRFFAISGYAASMGKPQNNLDEFLGNLLRGVSKLVGCNSTNLIVINEDRQEICVRIGVTSGAYETLVQMEALLGESFQGLTVPIDAATDSLITHVWREKTMCETSQLSDLIGSAMDASMVAQFDQMVGRRRYLLVPAVGSRHVFGVLLFEKEDARPYSRQQREVLLRYARRIGEILESDLLGHRGRQSHLGLPNGLVFWWTPKDRSEDRNRG